jgi:hypothetical protein
MKQLVAHSFLGTVAGILLLAASSAFAQIQYTVTCPAGQWDMVAISVLDPGLVAAHYHMQGSLNGTQTAYKFTTWNQTEKKIYYIKNPQGYPWDINLYDSSYIYQWITEVTWTDPYQYKKFNNGTGTSTADFSFRWTPRCGTPGSTSFWNPPTPGVQNNSRYELHPKTPTDSPSFSECSLPAEEKYLGWTLLELKPVSDFTISDTRTNPATSFTAQSLPLQYTYGCTSQNVNSCKFREVFNYATDKTVNPVDGVKHSYGWVNWRYYTNSTGGNGTPANWVQQQYSIEDHLTANSPANAGTVDFPCF